MNSSDRTAQKPALPFAWRRNRVWAATARGLKNHLVRWRKRVLFLTVLGALLGTLCQQSASWELPASWPEWLSNALGYLSAVALALAAYCTKEMLAPSREQHWTRARSLAEALKSEIFKFRTRIAPYDADDHEPKLVALVTALQSKAADLRTAKLTPEQEVKGMPVGFLSVKDYIALRVREQIEQYYVPRAEEHRTVVGRARIAEMVLGGIGACLGVIGGSGQEFAAGWIAVFGLIATAIAAHVYAGRHAHLVVIYQGTERRLDALAAEWEAGRKTDNDKDARERFVRACEEAISVENASWLAEWATPEPAGTT